MEKDYSHPIFPATAENCFHVHAHTSPCSTRMTRATSSMRRRAFLPMKCSATAGQYPFGTPRAVQPFLTNASHALTAGSSARLGLPRNLETGCWGAEVLQVFNAVGKSKGCFFIFKENIEGEGRG